MEKAAKKLLNPRAQRAERAAGRVGERGRVGESERSSHVVGHKFVERRLDEDTFSRNDQNRSRVAHVVYTIFRFSNQAKMIAYFTAAGAK